MHALPRRDQTVWHVIGNIALGMLVCVGLPAFWNNFWLDPDAVVANLVQGSVLAIWLVTAQYARLPMEKRLAPTPTLMLGGCYLALIGWIVVTAPRGMDGAMLVVAALVSMPGLYLIFKAMQSVRAVAP